MVIQINEQFLDKEEGFFNLELTFGNQERFSIRLKNPHTPKIEENLEWYFEEYIDEPYTAETRVQREKQRIIDYGLNLFEQLFEDRAAYAQYKDALESNGFENLTFEIINREDTLGFQSILWETLRDPDLKEAPLIAKGVSFYRKSRKPAVLSSFVKEQAEINLLIITARPNEENDINYRTIQRPLIDIIAKTGVRVNPYILRPGTFKALIEHLKEVKSGHYHIIHFDLHGEVLAYQALNRERDKGKVRFSYNHSFGKSIQTFQVRYGLEDLKPFEGKQAFLFFESPEKGKAEPATATEVAKLIRDYRIPVCILNACQSAKQDGDTQETSLAKNLQEEGVDLVLAMRYSVSVSAAKMLMERFYQALFENKPIGEAISLGRRVLHDNKNRSASLGFEIELEDWALPIIYQREVIDFKIRDLTKVEKKQRQERRKKLPRFPQFPNEFTGRDLDILKIEKLLLPPQNHLLIRGMVGVGKSALLQYLTAWWQLTNFRAIENAIYFDFKTKKYTTRQFINRLAQHLFLTYQTKNLKVDGLDYWTGECLDKLNRVPYALILDNVFQFKNKKTLDFLSQIQGKSFVAYGSVNEEAKLRELTFKNNVYQLDGLDKEATYQLASQILKTTAQKDIEQLLKDHKFELEHLLQLLAGFPSVMEKVLPFLKNMTVPQVLEGFRNGTLDIEF